MDGAAPVKVRAANLYCTHYGLCSLALANPALDERAIAQRLCSEYTFAGPRIS